MNNTSLDIGHQNTTGGYKDGGGGFFQFVATCIIICLGLPLTLGAIYGLCSQMRNGEAASIYVINLLISDLVQFVCVIILLAEPEDMTILAVSACFYAYCLMVSVCFMVCIALERYLVLVHPLWYHCRRTIKTSVMVCVVAWIVPLACVLTEYFSSEATAFFIILIIFFLLPLPLLLFFLVATLKALSASISVSTEEKRRIAGMLILVLLIYLLLFLPGIIWFINDYVQYRNQDYNQTNLDLLYELAPMFFKLSPLADLVLYIILRKGTIRQLSACVCHRRKHSNETSSEPV